MFSVSLLRYSDWWFGLPTPLPRSTLMSESAPKHVALVSKRLLEVRACYQDAASPNKRIKHKHRWRYSGLVCLYCQTACTIRKAMSWSVVVGPRYALFANEY